MTSKNTQISLKKRASYLILFFTLFATLSYTHSLFANELTIQVNDTKKMPISDVVAYAIPTSKKQVAQLKANYAKNPQSVTIHQRNKDYDPRLSVVQTGTAIRFSNHDNVKHHVYSFSKIKSFEIPLYSGEPPEAIIFDKPGVVALGCNIHDWMMAHVVIVNTPFYAISNAEGNIVLNNLPQGEYQLTLWHSRQKAIKNQQKIINIPSKNKKLSFNIALKSNWRKFNKKPTNSATSLSY